MQIAAGIVLNNRKLTIEPADIEWVVQSGHYAPRPEKQIPVASQIGLANGLAVYGVNQGMLLEIEVSVLPVNVGQGQVLVTGIVEEEMQSSGGQTRKRKSTIKGSVETVLTVLRHKFAHLL